MKSETTKKFRLCFADLPKHIKELAKKNYYLWLDDAEHPSIQFKKVHENRPIYSARVGIHYRALGILEENTAIWFWIGSHAEYDFLLKQF